MRAIFVASALLVTLLAGCDQPEKKSPDPRTFAEFMAAGVRANLNGHAAEAETDFRAAVNLAPAECEQQDQAREKQGLRRQGKNCPLLAQAQMSLALQLSTEGKISQAEPNFADASRILDAAPDAALNARLLHYQGVHLLDQYKSRNNNKSLQAAVLLDRARSAYQALLPSWKLEAQPHPVRKIVRNPFDPNSRLLTRSNWIIGVVPDQPAADPNLLGLIEVYRYLAIARRDVGAAEEADVYAGNALRLMQANNVARASIEARVYRTLGVDARDQAAPGREVNEGDRSLRPSEIALIMNRGEHGEAYP